MKAKKYFISSFVAMVLSVFIVGTAISNENQVLNMAESDAVAESMEKLTPNIFSFWYPNNDGIERVILSDDYDSLITAGNTFNGISFYEESGNQSFFVVDAARHGSEYVAQEWDKWISPGETTFNHSPGKLNFAFKLDYIDVETGEGSYRFKDIVIAQGHESSRNNWWFGGKGCTYVGNDTVTCFGEDSNNGIISLDFTRGAGTNVNEIGVSMSGYL